MSFLAEQFALLAEAQGGIPALRRLILDMAVRGKLVAQNPADEPADVLLERIAAEKARLVAVGEMKAGKPLPPISEEEMPYDLPPGWVWTNIGEVVIKLTDGEHIRPKTVSNGVYFLSAKDVREDGVSFSDTLFVTENDAYKFRQRCDPRRGDILVVSRGATVGRSCLVDTDELFCLLGSVILIRASKFVEPRYLLNCLQSPDTKTKVVSVSGATAQQAIYLRDIKPVVIPLPPFAEQARIVDRVESLLAQCDALEAAQTARAEKRALFAAAAWSAVGNSDYEAWHSVRDHFPLVTATPADVKLLREAILQLAVRGKLVAQDRADEPADLLLERIAAEKARLVAAGEMKVGKALPPISEEEMPYDLPPGWVWVRAGEFLLQRGKAVNPSLTPNTTYELYSVPSYQSRKPEYVQGREIGSNKQEVAPSQVLLSRINPHLNRVWIVGDFSEHPKIASTEWIVFDTLSVALPSYLSLTLSPPDVVAHFVHNIAGIGGSLSRFSPKVVSALPISLPPLAEQARIVERVESLLAQCDALEAALAAREQTQAALAGAIREK